MTLLRLLRRPSPLLLLEDVAVGESGLRRKAPLGSPASIFSPLQLVHNDDSPKKWFLGSSDLAIAHLAREQIRQTDARPP